MQIWFCCAQAVVSQSAAVLTVLAGA